MVHIVFEYKDQFSRGKWNKQECVLESVTECIRVYGLEEPGCEYHILKVIKV